MFIKGAPGYLIKTVAGPALKMVVVFFARSFVERAKFGRIDFYEPSSLDKKFQVAVHRCLVERFHRSPSGFENFIDAQRPVDLPKNLLDGVPLVRFPLHTVSQATS